MERLPKTFRDILDSVGEALQNERIVPALILIYSAIDNFSHLAEIEGKSDGTVFKEWVKKWMLVKYPLPCNEIDIWSARCGLLHQQISESKLTKDGKARQIYYSHGGADPRPLQLAIELADKDAICVVLEDLIESFKCGMVDCLSEIQNNQEWKKTFDLKEKRLFVTMKSNK